jgi:hypothetical protein
VSEKTEEDDGRQNSVHLSSSAYASMLQVDASLVRYDASVAPRPASRHAFMRATLPQVSAEHNPAMAPTRQGCAMNDCMPSALPFADGCAAHTQLIPSEFSANAKHCQRDEGYGKHVPATTRRRHRRALFVRW